jgi:hypothetical protein
MNEFDPTPYKCKAKGCDKGFSKRSSLAVHHTAHARRGELIATKTPHSDFGYRADCIKIVYTVPDER